MNILYQEFGHLGVRKRKGLAKTYSFNEGSLRGGSNRYSKARQSKAKHNISLLHTRNVYFVPETENAKEHSMQFG